jgi:hypothetical protein
MEDGYPTHVKHGIAALYLDGCTITGIAKHLGISDKTAKKHAMRAEAYIATYSSREEFMRTNYRADYATAIKQRTTDGKAGLLGGRASRDAAQERERRNRLLLRDS